MTVDVVRTSVDIPRQLHARLREAAAKQGCSMSELIQRAIARVVQEERPRRLKLDPPLIEPAGRRITVSNAEAGL